MTEQPSKIGRLFTWRTQIGGEHLEPAIATARHRLCSDRWCNRCLLRRPRVYVRARACASILLPSLEAGGCVREGKIGVSTSRTGRTASAKERYRPVLGDGKFPSAIGLPPYRIARSRRHSRAPRNRCTRGKRARSTVHDQIWSTDPGLPTRSPQSYFDIAGTNPPPSPSPSRNEVYASAPCSPATMQRRIPARADTRGAPWITARLSELPPW